MEGIQPAPQASHVIAFFCKTLSTLELSEDYRKILPGHKLLIYHL